MGKDREPNPWNNSAFIKEKLDEININDVWPSHEPIEPKVEKARKKLKEQLSSGAPKDTLDHWNKQKTAEQKKKEKRQRLIDESNILRTGERDFLGEIHNAMNFPKGPYVPGQSHVIDEKLVEPEMRHHKKVNGTPSKPGWGRWGNQTRKQASETMVRHVLDKLNAELASLDMSD